VLAGLIEDELPTAVAPFAAQAGLVIDGLGIEWTGHRLCCLGSALPVHGQQRRLAGQQQEQCGECGGWSKRKQLGMACERLSDRVMLQAPVDL
jgi:hypothetical protein